MGKEIGLPQNGPNIRPADASVFKKAPGEREYNTIVKLQSAAEDLMNARGPKENVANEGFIPIGPTPTYTEQTLAMIKGCLDITEINLKDESVQAYLVTTFGEEQAQRILQERTSIQQQLVEQYNNIIRSPDQPKEEA